jgi:glycogen(starch) synthase
MNLLVHSRFYPNVGGIETVADLLTREWHKAGIDIIVASDLRPQSGKEKKYPFAVHYQPSPAQWLGLIRWADLFVHINVSLKAFWPRLIVRRPLVAIHQGCYFVSRDNDRDWKEKLKLFCARRIAENIAASRYVASATGLNCRVIPNPYDDSIFRHEEEVGNPRTHELAFVGRLVSDKGCELLIRALFQLGENGLHPHLTVIGDGPERSSLERLAGSLSPCSQVEFVGARHAENVARSLRQHEILVVPSLWEEPFGIVALEGAASGCVVVGSNGGGLPEAIGPAGITFRRGDVSDLAAKLACLLRQRQDWQGYRDAAAAHLALHQPARIAQRYLEVFAQVLGAHAPLKRAANRMSEAKAAR